MWTPRYCTWHYLDRATSGAAGGSLSGDGVSGGDAHLDRHNDGRSDFKEDIWVLRFLCMRNSTF